MAKRVLKYTVVLLIVLSTVQMIFGISVPFNELYHSRYFEQKRVKDSLEIADSVAKAAEKAEREIPRHIKDSLEKALDDETVADMLSHADSIVSLNESHDTALRVDSILNRREQTEETEREEKLNRISSQSPKTDTMVLRHKTGGFNEIVHGKSTDSMIYDLRANKVYVYNEGDVTYGTDMNLKADYMEMDANTKVIFAYGSSDTLGNVNRPVFDDGKSTYTLDTINYNLGTGKAKIKGIQTQDGDGFFVGSNVKMIDKESFYASDGRYTTCDFEHPHFYIRMTRAKVIPNKKVITGYAYMVAEDVPLYFPGIPEGFFPMTRGRSSGFIIPSFGEETQKGFFIRGGGYYFALSEHADLTLLGGIYTLGSWEVSAASRYVKRYVHQGNLQADFSQDIIGDKGSADYSKGTNMKLVWTHTQDAKYRPGSTFSASVNYMTSGYSTKSSTTLTDRVTAQTNSSISYSKSWAGTPFSFNTNLSMSQNTRTDEMSLNFPTANFKVSRIYPFKRKESVGKQRWYEKISMSYSASLKNSVTTKTDELFSDQTLKNMKYGIQHTIPVSASYNIFNYINVTPSANYTENWLFRKMTQEYDPETQRAAIADTTYGFFRVYNYSVSVSASTTIYGMWDFSTLGWGLVAVRHVMEPTIGFSYNPDFGSSKYGFYQPVQSNANGDVTYYSPFANEAFNSPGRGRSGSLVFGLNQSIEAKVRSKRDTTGVKKVKFIESFAVNGSYNFFADSLNLSTISWSLRAKIPGLENVGLNVSGTWDPYQVDVSSGSAVRINKFMLAKGKLFRMTALQTSFGYSLNSKQSTNASTNQPAINSQFGDVNPFLFDPENPIAAAERRIMMTNTYYDFSIPWNLSLSYSFRYTNDGLRTNTTQTLTFSGSVNLTPNMGVTFSSGYDFVAKKITTGTLTLSRDLHCWQFSFTCVPIGRYKSWSFNISARSPLLRDLKYDKRNNSYDNVFDN